MARMIKYRAQCFYCGEWFEKGQAFLQRTGGKWKCQCRECLAKRKAEPARGGEG